MVHGRSLLQMFTHALQYVDLDCAVREMDTEEFGFEFLETFFVFHCLLLFLGYLLPFPLSIEFLLSAVVFGFEVGGTKKLRAVYVLAQAAEHIHIIAPKGNNRYIVAVTDCNLIGLPILVKRSSFAKEIA